MKACKSAKICRMLTPQGLKHIPGTRLTHAASLSLTMLSASFLPDPNTTKEINRQGLFPNNNFHIHDLS